MKKRENEWSNWAPMQNGPANAAGTRRMELSQLFVYEEFQILQHFRVTGPGADLPPVTSAWQARRLLSAIGARETERAQARSVLNQN